jgi:pimeloyl-ACP methyl ester carboxylesterase
MLEKSPSAPYYIVGHSAGADVAILAADYMIHAGLDDNLRGVILLDPTLTWTPPGKSGTSLLTEFDTIVGTVPVFVGATSSSDRRDDLYLGGKAPSSVFEDAKYVGQPGYTYEYYTYGDLGEPDNVHMALSMDLTVMTDATGAMK